MRINDLQRLNAYFDLYQCTAYYEACNAGSYSYDQSIEAPNAIYNGERVFFDDVRSVTAKTQWAVNNNIGGCFTWDVTMDDFNNNFCGKGQFPLLNAAITVLTGISQTVNGTTVAPTTVSATGNTTASTSSISSTASTTPISCK